MFERFARLSTGQTIVKNILSLTAANIVSKLIGFVTIAYLARVLSVSGFGQISFAQAIISYFALSTNLGLTTFGIREVARDKDHIKRYVNNILTLRMVLTVVSFGFLVVFLVFIKKPVDYKSLIAFYGLSLFPSALSLDWVFQGIERMELIGIAGILRSVAYAGLIFLFINSPSNILSVPLFALAASFIAVVLPIYIFVKKYGWFSFSFNWRIWKEFLIKALPMGLAYMMVQIYNNLDSVMLGFMRGDEAIGLYSAAYKIVILLTALRGILVSTVFPILSRAYVTRDNDLPHMVSYGTRLGITLAIPLGVGGTLLAKPMVAWIYGVQYEGCVLALQVLLWYTAVLFINLLFPQLLNAINQQKFYAVVTIAGAVVNVIFNFLLIPRNGIVGAAIATLLAQVCVLIAAYTFARRFMRISIARFFWKPALASLVMAIPLILLQRLQVLALIAIGIVCYFIVLWLLKGISIAEIRRFLHYEE